MMRQLQFVLVILFLSFGTTLSAKRLWSYSAGSMKLKAAGTTLRSTPPPPSSFRERSIKGVLRFLPPATASSPALRLVPRAAPSALPGTKGFIQVTVVATGAISYISATLNSDGNFGTSSLPNALPVILPSTCPTTIINIQSTDGDVGLSVDSSKPLSTGSMVTSRFSKRAVSVPSPVDIATAAHVAAVVAAITAAELLAVDQIRFDEISADNAVQQAAEKVYLSIQTARYDAGGMPGDAADVTALNAYNAASQTAATAASQQLFVACVAAEAQETTLVTEANSALAVVAGTPTGAADAAALAVAVAANYAIVAAEPPDSPDRLKTTCGAASAPIFYALSATATQALQDAAGAQLAADKAAATSTTNAVAATADSIVSAQNNAAAQMSGSNFATFTPSQDGMSATSNGAVYSLDCATQGLTITYTNADGSKITPTTIFMNGPDIAVTGNIAATTAANPTIGPTVTLKFVATN